MINSGLLWSGGRADLLLGPGRSDGSRNISDYNSFKDGHLRRGDSQKSSLSFDVELGVHLHYRIQRVFPSPLVFFSNSCQKARLQLAMQAEY